MVIAITGENGFVGAHIMMRAKRRYGQTTIGLGRPFSLQNHAVDGIERVIHCAAVHRDNCPKRIYEKNMLINKSLINVLNFHKISPDIVMLSSIQEGDGSPYGASKQDGSALFLEFCQQNNSTFIKHNLNNIFGPLSHAYKYSFVATFCVNILNDVECSVIDREITLTYIDDVVDIILTKGETDLPKFNTSVGYVYEKLNFYNKMHLGNGTIPVFTTRFDFLLYCTLISFVDYPLTSNTLLECN
ncbi:NAD-dependent epimerase/dehydratase family protein [Planktomarina temperata]|nr:NAD-dependent epimerase/dehydratase family protein [bacterium]MDB2458912.1 NAD-dependent epimerase/dehydratase family protein [Planktomarina temperata]